MALQPSDLASLRLRALALVGARDRRGAVAAAEFAAGMALLAILDPDHGGLHRRVLWACLAVVWGVAASWAFTTWRRRRR